LDPSLVCALIVFINNSACSLFFSCYLFKQVFLILFIPVSDTLRQESINNLLWHFSSHFVLTECLKHDLIVRLSTVELLDSNYTSCTSRLRVTWVVFSATARIEVVEHILVTEAPCLLNSIRVFHIRWHLNNQMINLAA